MKQLLISVLGFALTGCAALVPVALTPAPTTTPQIVIQTVVVTVIVTLPPTKTPTPTLTPIPTFTPLVTAVSSTPGTAEATGTALTQTASGTSPTATLPADAGGTIFSGLTRSSDHFALQCQPDTITFGLTTTDSNVVEVDLFYRMENQSSGSISSWVDIGQMTPGADGTFTFDFKSSMVDADARSQKAWFDYQFVAISKPGRILGRSARILKQITYTQGCPE